MQVVRGFNVHHASDLREPLASSSKPVFYTHTLCPYAQRVFLALLYKAVPFELVQVDLSDKPRWYRSINPQGLVPTVVYQDTPYVESLDVCRWIDRAFCPETSLIPADSAGRQQMNELLQRTPAIVSAGLDLVSGSTARSWGCGTRPSRSQQQRFEQQCQHVGTALGQRGGPFLCGKEPSLADLALLPFFERFRLALQLFQDYDLAEVKGGTITQWMGYMHTLSWCDIARPDSNKICEALTAHQCLDFFDYVTYNAYQVHPHLQATT